MKTIQMILKEAFYPAPTSGAEASALIRQELSSNRPSMVARFGSTEIKAVLYPGMPFPMRLVLRKRILGNMATLSGFFPSTPSTIRRFSDLMFADMKELDILGSWRLEEKFLVKRFPAARRVELRGLEPYFSNEPWTTALEGKKVLVVHPFNRTIESQYANNRTKLFKDPRILPEFASLQTIKAVQTIAGTASEFESWFDALDSMKSQMDRIDYDVVILGCGAYGFPLAAHAKRSGKKAVHLGGPTQILFGIRGKRWDDHPVVSRFYNEAWVRPGQEDTPKGATKVENGCYW